jgi:imidazolonepropionase-like amidohydrolase
MEIVTAATVWTAFPGEAHRPGAVVVDGDRIAAVGTAGPILAAAAPTDRVADLGRVAVLPGLIDAHVHLCFDGSDDPIGHLRSSDDDRTLSLMERNAALLLRSGVTTARDLGSRVGLAGRLRSRIAAGDVDGPDLLFADAPLTSPDGHCWFLGGECDGPTAIRRAVRDRRSAGASWIKVMVSGGFLTTGTSVTVNQFSDTDLRLIVDEARSIGLRVAAHAHSTDAIRSAVFAGVDTVEHGNFLAADGVDFDLSVVDLMADRGVALCPTVNRATLTLPVVSGEQALGRLGEMRARGVTVIAGTDAGVRAVTPDAYGDGLVMLTRSGMRPVDVLHAATGGAADALGLGDVGRLRPGARADLIAVDGDPTEDLAAIGSPVWVMHAGRVAALEPTAGRRTGGDR